MALDFAGIKKYYDDGKWNADMVYTAVERGVITAEQYKTITGEDYTPTSYSVDGGSLRTLSEAGLIDSDPSSDTGGGDDTTGDDEGDTTGGGGSSGSDDPENPSSDPEDPENGGD